MNLGEPWEPSKTGVVVTTTQPQFDRCLLQLTNVEHSKKYKFGSQGSFTFNDAEKRMTAARDPKQFFSNPGCDILAVDS